MRPSVPHTKASRAVQPLHPLQHPARRLRGTATAWLIASALALGAWLIPGAPTAYAATQSVTTSCDRSSVGLLSWKAIATTGEGDSGILTGALQQRTALGTWITVAQGSDSTAPFAVQGSGSATLRGPLRVVAQFTDAFTGFLTTDIEYCT